MNALQRAAFRHIRSFRREEGSLYGAYTAVYSRVYGLAMSWRHRGAPSFREGELLPASQPMPSLDEFAARQAQRDRAIQAHCRKRHGHCAWCGKRTTEVTG